MGSSFQLQLFIVVGKYLQQIMRNDICTINERSSLLNLSSTINILSKFRILFVISLPDFYLQKSNNDLSLSPGMQHLEENTKYASAGSCPCPEAPHFPAPTVICSEKPFLWPTRPCHSLRTFLATFFFVALFTN